jgi:hypothetical protein
LGHSSWNGSAAPTAAHGAQVIGSGSNGGGRPSGPTTCPKTGPPQPRFPRLLPGPQDLAHPPPLLTCPSVNLPTLSRSSCRSGIRIRLRVCRHPAPRRRSGEQKFRHSWPLSVAWSWEDWRHDDRSWRESLVSQHEYVTLGRLFHVGDLAAEIRAECSVPGMLFWLYGLLGSIG